MSEQPLTPTVPTNTMETVWLETWPERVGAGWVLALMQCRHCHHEALLKAAIPLDGTREAQTPCPRCQKAHGIRWTVCGRGMTARLWLVRTSARRQPLLGQGYTLDVSTDHDAQWALGFITPQTSITVVQTHLALVAKERPWNAGLELYCLDQKDYDFPPGTLPRREPTAFY